MTALAYERIGIMPCFRYTLAEVETDPLAVIRAVMAVAPILTSEGWGHDGLAGNSDPKVARAAMLNSDHVAGFVRAAEWLDRVPRRQTVNRSGTSYGWKHTAEAWHERQSGPGQGYISNGMFLAACLATGCLVQPIRGSPNAYVAIPQSALRLP